MKTSQQMARTFSSHLGSHPDESSKRRASCLLIACTRKLKYGYYVKVVIVEVVIVELGKISHGRV